MTWQRLGGAPGTLVAGRWSLSGRVGSGRKVVGYLLANGHLTFLANGPFASVEEVMVDEGHRRSGVGRELMGYAENWAGESRPAYLALPSRRAGPFYLALGYEDSAVFFKKTLA